MKAWLKLQQQNAFLWAPFLMAAGGAMYFAAPNEICIAGIAIAAAAAMFGIVRKNKYAVAAGALFIFGISYAYAYSHLIATPRLYHPMRNAEITGRVTGIDYTPDKTRLFISVPAEQIKSKLTGNATVRLNLADGPAVAIGDTVRVTASMFPPAASYAPETFDYSRWAYFNGLSATGFINDITVTSHADATGIGTLRDRLHKYGNSFLADTLVLGYKNAIPKQDGAVWTAAGIGHVWSISGFHMTLVAGWLFAIFYCVLRMIPFITRRIPARIPALVCAWAGLLFYLFLSGMDVATIRAFLMTSLGFAAFIIGRNAISMRNICIAFCIIFLINPHYVMQPGFQLSFSAIFGLVWFWNDRRCRKTTRIGKIGYAVYAAAMTSVVATIFTAPFVAAHFYSMPVYGLIGNLILLPVFSFAIMPAVIIGTVTATFGWTWPLGAAQYLYSHALQLAREISSLPYANVIMPHVPNIAMAMIIFGFLAGMFIKNDTGARTWIMRHVNTCIAMLFIACGAAVTVTHSRPVFYASPDHELVAFSYDGRLQFNKARASNHFFAFDTWRQRNGEPVGTPNVRRRGDRGVWIYETENFRLAYIQKFVPLMREINTLCNDEKTDYIVSYFDVTAPRCDHKILRGGFVIYPSGRVRHNAPRRPWNSPRQ